MLTMRYRRLFTAAAVLLGLAVLYPQSAQGQEEETLQRLERLEQQVRELLNALASRDSADLVALRLQIDALTSDIEALKLGQEVVAQADESSLGFGPAASKVYRVQQGVSVGGYGELLYENAATERQDGTISGRADQLDFLRGIVYVGYKFNNRILFNSEIEVEHSTTGQAGSVSLEFAYLDYRLADEFGIRAGLLLAPMGFINELHEPPTFLGTERPETERQIIPSTWRENGIGIFGEAGGLAYRAYLLAGLDAIGGGASKAAGFSASGLRGGRQKGSKSSAEDFAGVVRLDYVGTPGLRVGGSAYLGESGQGASSPSSPAERLGARTVIAEGHLEYRAYGFDVRGLLAVATVDDAAELNVARGLSGAESIGERLLGWYVGAGYDVLRSARTEHQLIPYVRYETLNTQDKVPAGYAADPANDREIISIGAVWKPISTVVFKGDFQIHRDGALTGVNQINATVGYLF
jgi:hypothetical protein